MDLTGLGDLLCITPPWKLKEVKVQPKNNVIDVYIDYERGSKFPCQQCGNPSPVHDSDYKRVRQVESASKNRYYQFAQHFAVIRSVIDTTIKNGQDVLMP